MKRIIAVVTSTRADYSHLYWPLRDLSAHPELDLRILALGTQQPSESGGPAREAETNTFPIHGRIECQLSSRTDVGMAKTIGLATLGLADALGQLRPQLLLLVADRYEMLAPAAVALALRIPIAHIAGSEISRGPIDDAVRHALTEMSHIHFTATERERQRLIATGEDEWRVQFTGVPSLDRLRREGLYTREELELRLRLDLKQPTVLVAYRPVASAGDTEREVEALFGAVASLREHVIFCYLNGAAGNRKLIERTRDFLKRRRNGSVFVNLDAITYLSLLASVDLMVGNSGSGIQETASLKLPTVNVGLRQHGRERAANILDAPADPRAILETVSKARSAEFRRSLAGITNPYGDGHASERMVKLLATVPLGETLLLKQSFPQRDSRPAPPKTGKE